MVQDVRYGIRLLIKHRAFSAVAVLTLALGIGLSTALFTVIDAALLRPLPYPRSHELVTIGVVSPQGDGRTFWLGASSRDLRQFRNSTKVFAHAGDARYSSYEIVDAGTPERLTVQQVSEDYLEVFGVRPIIGRSIEFADTRLPAPDVAILGYDYWRTRFNADPAVIGRSISVSDRRPTIVGVLPRGFNPDVSVWTALKSPAPGIRGWDREVVGRLRGGVSIDRAQQELSGLLEGIERGRRNPATGVQLRSLYSYTTEDYADTVAMLGGAVGLILLIACVNVAGLLLARGGVRRTELAVRAAIGAGRPRLLRQLLTESVLLAVAGGGLGILLAWISLDSLLALLPLRLPANVKPAMNVLVLGLSVALSALTALVAGVLPAMRLSRVDTNPALARNRRMAGSTLTTRSSQLLVGAQVALAVVLLIGGGLLARSLSRLMSTEIGIDPNRFVTFDVEPTDVNPTVRKNYYPALVEALRALPGVEAAGATSIAPLSGGYGMTGGKVEGGKEAALIRWDALPGFLDAIGLPALQGRLPSAGDSGQSRVVINETAKRTFFGDESPNGRDMVIGGAHYEVSAVVGDVRLSGPTRPIEAQAYLFGGSADLGPMTMVIRSRPGVALHAEQLREVAASIGPRVLVDSVNSGADLLASNSGVATPRQRTILLALLAAFGLLLTLVGIASVTASAVTRRRNEIGIRVALGATPVGVVVTMMRDMATPTVMGLVAGLTGAYFATALITTFLFDTAPHDWLTFALVALGVCVSALTAAWLPARRAARVDPVVALRAE